MASSRQSKTNSPLQSTRQMLDELDALMERMLALPVGDKEELPPLPRDVPATPTNTLLASLTPAEELFEEAVVETPVRERAEQIEAAESAPVSARETVHKAVWERSPEPTDELAPPSGQTATAVADTLTYFRDSELPSEPRTPRLKPDADPFGLRDDRDSSDSERTERLDPATDIEGPHFFPESFQEQLPPPLVIHRPVKIVTAPDQPRLVLGNLCLAPFVWANQSFDQCTTLLGPLGRSLRGSRGRSFLGILGILSLAAAGAWLVLERVGWP